MNKNYYAILDSTYSNYFKDLSSVAEHKYGYKCVRLSYSFADNIYLHGIKNCRARCALPENLLSEVLSESNFLQSKTYISQRGFNADVIRYLERLYAMLLNYEPKFTIIYNDRRWNHYYAKRLLDLLNYRYFIIERGIFRGQTTTCDPAGLASDSKFYKEALVSDLIDCPITFSEGKRRKASTVKFGVHFCVRLIEGWLLRKFVWHNSKSLLGYLRKVISRKPAHTLVPEPGYTLVPLQLNEDSQIKFHSPYETCDEFLAECISLLPDTENIVLAHHPEAHDLQLENEYNNCTHVVGCSDELIKNAKQVFTINSTVGFKALELGIRVHFFGVSVGSKHPLANEYSGGELLEKSDRFGDDRVFWNNLRHRYQLPGDIHCYSVLDLEQSFLNLIAKSKLTDAKSVASDGKYSK